MRAPAENRGVRIFLCGDVMTGRGIDQVLPSPSNPLLYEQCVRDAREYVSLAEEVSGPIPRAVDPAYVWGDALAELQRAELHARIINLETSITRSEHAWPGKGIHYRMHPGNIGCIAAAGIDCCALANNHILDWGYEGLAETLQTLDEAGIPHTGAGRNQAEAASPAVIQVPHQDVRVRIFSVATPGSGVPIEWSATGNGPGLNVLTDLSPRSARRITDQIGQGRRPGDLTIVSIHWGPNWGYDIPDEQIDFAHRLAEEGVDIVHGHSSHHVKAIEAYRDRLILYGCGDFLTDYEGISGHERFRGDLALMYLAGIDPRQGRLSSLRLVPMQMRRFRLQRASAEDTAWLRDLLNREGAPFGTSVRLEGDNRMTLQWR